MQNTHLRFRFPSEDKQEAIANLADVDEQYIDGHHPGVKGDRGWVQSRYVACARLSNTEA